MHATAGEWAWTAAISLALAVSAYLAMQVHGDYLATMRANLNGLRRLVSVDALWSQSIHVAVLVLFEATAASSLFVESAAPLTTRAIVIRWGFVIVALAIVGNQFASLRRRRQMLEYARAERAA